MPRWTDEARAKQAEAIRRWKPWERSTGPRTAAGKARASANSLTHGIWRGETWMRAWRAETRAKLAELLQRRR
ncbi:hypothetical protein [Thiomonas arsenitoxydans]|uniref:hypothetical protein n=1 Tax=Thiomonas arsenitoxydans (strain DSM 22701 / CIP 110005 / 3As) TaxID=426114 RepID=UPI0009A77221|nr:hypothetical protein [Thiomonas arsenitoxydans]